MEKAQMTLPERIDTLNTEARAQLRHALEAGNERLTELDEALARLAKDDWSVPGLRRHLGELRARAEDLRAAALKRAYELPGRAVAGFATRTRGPVRSLAKELAQLARRVAPPARPAVVKAAPDEPPKPGAAKAS